MNGLRAARAVFAFWAAIAGSAWLSSARAAGEWQVPEAPVRFKLTLTKKPTHPSAGYFAHLPDGGLLRGVAPSPVVMAEDGKPIPSFLLWHNSDSGFSLVFAEPAGSAKSVYVYVRTDRLPALWKPESGLTPSAILCVNSGRDSLPLAQNLAKLGHVDATVSYFNKAGIPKAPLSIGGDETGRPKPGSFFLLAYIEAPENGKYWVAPFVKTGVDEILIDGSKLSPKEHSKMWGGTGANVDLQRGLHRVEIFQTAPGSGPYDSNPGSGGLMYLTWRTPKDRFKEIESRVIKDTEIVRSGSCLFERAEARDGAPVACGIARPGLTYWFGNEEPLIVYDLLAVKSGNPEDTTYHWTFPEGGALDGYNAKWIFPGFHEHHVKLTAKSAKGVSQCDIPFFGFGTTPTSLDQAAHRVEFRTVLGKMLEAYPRTPDPVANWSDAYWNNLLRTVEEGEGLTILRQLFTDRWDTVHKKLGPSQVSALQDILVDAAQRDNPAEAVQWLEKFYANTSDFARRNELKLRHSELLMFYLGDGKAAGQLLTSLAGLPGDLGDRAKVRLGDLAFIEGDLNKATSFYADVQNRARLARNAPKFSGGLATTQLLQGAPPAAAAPDWRNSPLPLQNKPEAPAASKGGALQAGALQEVSLSENVRTFTESGYLLEARQALGVWEREFPLSKVSGDFIIQEARLYMKMGDYKRPQPMLEAYCREIDASSFLPEAAGMLINCVKQTKAPRESIREIIQKVQGRLKYHPVAKELDAFLAGK